MDRLGKLFRVEGANRRCLCCDRLFSQQQAPDHAQVPCRPDQKAAMEKTCESHCTHESAH